MLVSRRSKPKAVIYTGGLQNPTGFIQHSQGLGEVDGWQEEHRDPGQGGQGSHPPEMSVYPRGRGR